MAYYRMDKSGRFCVQIHTLLEAIMDDNLKAMKDFLNKTEEDIDKLDSAGYTPVALAVEKGCDFDMVKYLVNQGADVCKVGRNGKTPLCLAIEKGNLEMITFLLENGAEYSVQSAFLTAIQTKNLKITSMLKEKGALVNHTYCNGHTPLTKTVEAQDPAITKYLIDNGADVEVVIKDKMNSYLLKCVKDKKLDMVRILCEVGCNLDKPGECGYTPLTKATEVGSFGIVQCLIQHGANINSVDTNNKTALAIAASNSSFTIVRYLIDAGADVQLAKTEVEEYRRWNDDLAWYMASLKLKPKNEETGHEEDTT